MTKSFPQEEELKDKIERLTELNALLNMDEKGSDEYLDEQDEVGEVAERKISDSRPTIMDKLAMLKEQKSQTPTEPVKQKNKVEIL